MNIATITFFAAQVLFPAAETKPQGYDGAQVRVEEGVAVVDVAPRHKFSGVNFVFPQPFALNRYDAWYAEVSNRTDRTLDFIAHGIAKGTPKRFAAKKFRVRHKKIQPRARSEHAHQGVLQPQVLYGGAGRQGAPQHDGLRS